MMKWCLVAAGLKDLSRPPEKLSVSQNLGMQLNYFHTTLADLAIPTMFSSLY